MTTSTYSIDNIGRPITCCAVTSMSTGRNAFPNRFMEWVRRRVPMCSFGGGLVSQFAVHEWLPNDHNALHILRKSIPDVISGAWTHSRCCRSAPFSGTSYKIKFILKCKTLVSARSWSKSSLYIVFLIWFCYTAT